MITIKLWIGAAFLVGGMLFSSLITGLIISLRKRQESDRIKEELMRFQMLLQSEREKNSWLAKAEQKLRESFEALSAKVLRSNSEQLMQRSKEQLEGMLKVVKSDWGTQKQEIKGVVDPLSKGLEQLDKQIRLIEQKREGAYQGLGKQIQNLQTAYRNLNNTTTDLKRALTSSGEMRGKWGEMQLRRIAEMAGMVEHIDFEEQQSLNSQEGSLRPDMVVKLSGNGMMVVDAKAPMSAYLDAMQTDNPQERQLRLQDHANAVRKHMQQLSRKEYWSQFSPSPEFVAMFIPYESGLSAAFEVYPNLFEEAIKNKVVIVTPATLLALLRVVAYGWMQLSLAENAQKIAEQGRELYSRFCTFASHLQDVGKKLDSTVDSYNKVVGSMDSRLMPSARRLAKLGDFSDTVTPVKAVDKLPKQPRVEE